jgi:hypothetical protein
MPRKRQNRHRPDQSVIAVACSNAWIVRGGNGDLQEIQSRRPSTRKGIGFVRPQPHPCDADQRNDRLRHHLKAIAEGEPLPSMPHEIQDSLTIETGERHCWLADGSLSTAGTRTVRSNGCARRIRYMSSTPKLSKPCSTGAFKKDAETKA